MWYYRRNSSRVPSGAAQEPMHRRTYIYVAAIVAVWLTCLACTGSEEQATATPAPTPTPVIDVAAVLEQTGAVMGGLSTFHFRLRHEVGSLAIASGLVLDTVDGGVVRPDRISVTFVGNVGGFALDSSLISIGDASYMSNPLTGQWEEGPVSLTPLGFFSPTEGIAAMISQLRDPVLTVEAGPPRSYRISGTLPAPALSPLIGSAILPDAVVDLVLTVAPDGGHLTEARLTGRILESDVEGAVRVIELSAFDEPASIEPPL